MATLVGLAACQMNNPAFDGDEAADEVGDSGDTTAGDSTGGESGESGSSSDTGDTSDTSDTSDSNDTSDTGDPSDSDSTDGMTASDLPLEECEAVFTEPYSPIYGFDEAFNGGVCPIAVPNQYLKVTSNGPAAGLVNAQRCSGEGCSSCDGEAIPVGVVGLSDFANPLVALAQNQALVCIKVQTGTIRGIDSDSRCIYDSLLVGNLDTDLLLATHRSAQLPPAGAALLGANPPPAAGAQHFNCKCGQVYDLGDPNLECCEGNNDPYTTSLTFLGQDVMPGDVADVGLNGSSWKFTVAQAQLLPDCEDPQQVGIDMSWALIHGG